MSLLRQAPVWDFCIELGFVYHCNFEAKPTNSSDDNETMPFFGELMQIYPKDPCVTKCCILGSIDDVCSGNNGCGACHSGVQHPSEGFYVGDDHPRIYWRGRKQRTEK